MYHTVDAGIDMELNLFKGQKSLAACFSSVLHKNGKIL